MDTTRRNVLRVILASGAIGLAEAGVAQKVRGTPPGTGGAPRKRASELPPATDLAADGVRAARNRWPILLFFDREECPFCERALREYLVPFANEEWKGRALFRQVDIDRALPVKGFDGTATTHAAVAARYDVALSPTVLVVGPRGEPLDAPIVGLLTVDFYGAYLDAALQRGAARLRG